MDDFSEQIDEFDSFQDAIASLDKSLTHDDIALFIEAAFERFIDVPYGLEIGDIDKESDHIAVAVSIGKMGAPLCYKFGFNEIENDHKYRLSDTDLTGDRWSNDQYVYKVNEQPIVIVENIEDPKYNDYGETVSERQYYHCEIHYFNNDNDALDFFKNQTVDKVHLRLNEIANVFENAWESLVEDKSAEQQAELLKKLLNRDCFKAALSAMEGHVLHNLIESNNEQSQSMNF